MQDGEDFARSIGGIFLQMSARTGEGADPVVLADIASLIILRREENMSAGVIQEPGQDHDSCLTQNPLYTH